MSDKPLEKHDVDWFADNRPEHSQFVEKIRKCEKHVIVTAGVKVGKLELILIQAVRNEGIPATVKHVFITNFTRKDCRDQKKKLELYGVKAFYSDTLLEAVPYILSLVKKGIKVVVHVDESDYGSGSRQKMADIFKAIRKIKALVSLRFYSMTNEEVIFSEFAEECEHLEMSDPASFFGPDDYLDANLVSEAEPFWDGSQKCLSGQGEQACKNWIESEKFTPFSVLRIVTNDDDVSYRKLKSGVHSEAFREALSKFGIQPYFVDSDNEFFWGKAEEKDDVQNWWGMFNPKERRLIIINQTCVRSTGVGFHPLIYFWHDFRNKTSTYSTVAQAQLRAVYYPYSNSDKWADPSVKIKIYGCVKTFELAAKKLDQDTYCQESGRKLSSRVNSTSRDGYNMVVVDSEADIPQDVGFIDEDGNHKKLTKNTVTGNIAIDMAEHILLGKKPSSENYILVDLDDKTFDAACKNPKVKEKNKNNMKKLREQHPELIGKIIYFEADKKKTKHSTKKSSMYEMEVQKKETASV